MTETHGVCSHGAFILVEQAGKKQGKISKIVPDSDTYYEEMKQDKNNGDWTP